MTFTDHKIMEFTHKIADLPDEPTLSPQELKQRFDASPEELRQSVNSICDEGERLSARVEGIVVDTFGDTIDREMLSDELRAELDGKAEQTALAAEQTAREAGDGALQTQIAAKCEVIVGTYTADGKASQTIELGVTPKAVLVASDDGMFRNGDFKYGGFAVADSPSMYSSQKMIEIVQGGFKVYYASSGYVNVNSAGERKFIALV